MNFIEIFFFESLLKRNIFNKNLFKNFFYFNLKNYFTAKFILEIYCHKNIIFIKINKKINLIKPAIIRIY